MEENRESIKYEIEKLSRYEIYMIITTIWLSIAIVFPVYLIPNFMLFPIMISLGYIGCLFFFIPLKADYRKIDSENLNELDLENHLVNFSFFMKNENEFIISNEMKDNHYFSKSQILAKIESILPDDQEYFQFQIYAKKYKKNIETKEISINDIIQDKQSDDDGEKKYRN